ncbi:hypothetical protein [Pseudomonas kilonensis]
MQDSLAINAHQVSSPFDGRSLQKGRLQAGEKKHAPGTAHKQILLMTPTEVLRKIAAPFQGA